MTEFNHKEGASLLTLGVKDTQPIDFLDKMSDKEKDLKIMCESVDDFLKNIGKSNNKDD